MLKIVADPTFAGHADITDLGADAPVRIHVVWKHKTVEQLSAWFESNRDKPAADALMEIVADCPDLANGAGESIPFSRDALAVLLANRAAAVSEITSAYMTQLTESRIKNSKAPLAS